MEVVPVLDIRGGVAVSGVAGRREEYRPLKSVFSETSDPAKIAKALPFEQLYVADLDGIVEHRPDIKTLRALAGIKKTMIDLGVRVSEDLAIFDEFNCGVILGSETVKDRMVVSEALNRFGDRVIVSIDIKGGRVLSEFLPSNPLEAYHALVDLGVRRSIFLNISSVGTERSDFSFIKDLNKTGEILLGGGITKKDLTRLEASIVDGVLVGTALHKGLWM